MNKKILLIFAILFITTYANAIAIIAPAVYVATLSIIAFVSNILISVAAYSAAKGIFGRKQFGEKFSSKLSFALEITGKVVLLIIATAISVLLLNPLTLEEAIIAGVLAAIITLGILLLNSYKKIGLISKKEKKRMLTEIIVFSLFVFLSCSIISFISIEIQRVDPNTPQEKQSAFTLTLPSFDIGMAKSSSAAQENTARSDSSQGISAPSQEALITAPSSPVPADQNKPQSNIPQTPMQNFIFYPKNMEKCIITTETKTLTLTPTNNCITLNNGVRERTICPIIINKSEIAPDTKITSSGSCTENYNIS